MGENLQATLSIILSLLLWHQRGSFPYKWPQPHVLKETPIENNYAQC